ncbi:MAG: MBL fold metallo-hydrolase, partial [Tolumonas sp.]|nr:MBL fold metallo-hydrolase [Tolumonas sp.]
MATPARHASGRLVPQSNKTLWSGFALIGPAHRVYYFGGTGSFP